MNRPSALLLIVLPLCLEACASSGAYPSLSRRDSERVTGTAQPATPSAPQPIAAPPSASLQGNVDQLLGKARAAHGEFQVTRAATQRAVSRGRGAARASESWVGAQVALAELEASRADALTALAEIDQLYAEELIARPESVSPSAALLGAARAQLRTLVEEENSVLDGLANQFGG
ncbi:MAG: hypothetical protein P8J20_11790 [Novosphingobium sp.]|nr:hypothetical protein [Novosphingobium sp.]